MEDTLAELVKAANDLLFDWHGLKMDEELLKEKFRKVLEAKSKKKGKRP